MDIESDTESAMRVDDHQKSTSKSSQESKPDTTAESGIKCRASDCSSSSPSEGCSSRMSSQDSPHNPDYDVSQDSIDITLGQDSGVCTWVAFSKPSVAEHIAKDTDIYKFLSIKPIDISCETFLNSELTGKKLYSFEPLQSEDNFSAIISCIEKATHNLNLEKIHGNVQSTYPFKAFSDHVEKRVDLSKAKSSLFNEIKSSIETLQDMMESKKYTEPVIVALEHTIKFLRRVLETAVTPGEDQQGPMIEELFRTFCSIVKLDLQSGAARTERKMNMFGRELKSKPDFRIWPDITSALLKGDADGETNALLLQSTMTCSAVIEVKRNLELMPETRDIMVKKLKEEPERRLPGVKFFEKIRGELLGQMLLELNSSLQQNRYRRSMIGIAVTCTKVGFAKLIMQEEHLDAIKNNNRINFRSLKGKCFFTEVLDMTKTEDRIMLLTILHKIGSIVTNKL